MALKAKAINKFEFEILSKYLQENKGNVSKAAEAAHVPRRTFQRLLAKHKINADRFKNKEHNATSLER